MFQVPSEDINRQTVLHTQTLNFSGCQKEAKVPSSSGFCRTKYSTHTLRHVVCVVSYTQAKCWSNNVSHLCFRSLCLQLVTGSDNILFKKIFWPHCMACGILVPRVGLNLQSLYWKHGILTIGPPRKSLCLSILKRKSSPFVTQLNNILPPPYSHPPVFIFLDSL